MSLYDDFTTDELLDCLPNHLHLARNSNAPDHDRWRIYSDATKKYIEPGMKTARELLVYTLERNDKQMKEWAGEQ